MALGLREDEESGQLGGISGDRKLNCEPLAESRPQSRASWVPRGRKVGWEDFHGQRPSYTAFTFKVVVEQVCCKAEENWGIAE